MYNKHCDKACMNVQSEEGLLISLRPYVLLKKLDNCWSTLMKFDILGF
jgi:hypothetical protein